MQQFAKVLEDENRYEALLNNGKWLLNPQNDNIKQMSESDQWMRDLHQQN
jgi:sulfur transfer protein SufE